MAETPPEAAPAAPRFAFDYPELPITPFRGAVIEKLRQGQVLIVQGGTGSGKTTQLPKFLLEGGFTAAGLLGITQPRRIAALSIADRLRQETGQPRLIGAKIRFHEDLPRGAEVKVMTDGILLQEFRHDPLLRRYAVIVIDEAHERSLNVDILLGVLKQLLPRRPELKLVVTSATLDAERFSAFFGQAPVLQVEGRLFPVELEYWGGEEESPYHESEEEGTAPAWDPEGRPLPNAAETLRKSKRQAPAATLGSLERAAEAIRYLERRRPDNLLAFLPTEKEIRELQRELEKDLGRDFDLLPLYGRLSPSEQKRVFSAGGRPRIVLATNIAETSLTLPGIAYVVDTGLARISRFSAQARIQGLPIEPISKASAQQRLGRAGRVKPGRCIRLYSEEDFEARPAFTEPEILRSNLANVVLQLLSLRLDVETFPFPDPPLPAAVKGSFRQLFELGAVDAPLPSARITPEGRRLALLPVDVTVGKILLRAHEAKVLHPVMVLAAGLTVQDPLIRPQEEPYRSKADALHRRFLAAPSDFASLLLLWAAVHEAWREGLSQRRLRALCADNYWSFLRLREWMDLYEQFARLFQEEPKPHAVKLEGLDLDTVHKCLLGGFLAFLARKKPEDGSYRLAGNREAFLHPGSSLHKRRPEWVVAAEVRQTSRVFLYRAAEVKPAWVEEIAPEACKPSYFDIAWNPERGFVEAKERVTFKGFVLRQDRRIDYQRVAPEECEVIFWREGIAEAPPGPALDKRFPFLAENRRRIQSLMEWERRLRLPGFHPDAEAMAAWYRERAPGVASYPGLDAFLRQGGDALLLKAEDWLPDILAAYAPFRDEGKAAPAETPGSPSRPPTEVLEALFPAALDLGPVRARLFYRFDHGDALDGVTLETETAALPFLAQYHTRYLFLRLPFWGKWMADFFLEKMPRPGPAPFLAALPEILAAARQALDGGLAPGPALALALQTSEPGAALSRTLACPARWPTHLKLHLNLLDPATGRRHLVEITPDMGAAALFQAARNLLPAPGLGPAGGSGPAPAGSAPPTAAAPAGPAFLSAAPPPLVYAGPVPAFFGPGLEPFAGQDAARAPGLDPFPGQEAVRAPGGAANRGDSGSAPRLRPRFFAEEEEAWLEGHLARQAAIAAPFLAVKGPLQAAPPGLPAADPAEVKQVTEFFRRRLDSMAAFLGLPGAAAWTLHSLPPGLAAASLAAAFSARGRPPEADPALRLKKIQQDLERDFPSWSAERQGPAQSFHSLSALPGGLGSGGPASVGPGSGNKGGIPYAREWAALLTVAPFLHDEVFRFLMARVGEAFRKRHREALEKPLQPFLAVPGFPALLGQPAFAARAAWILFAGGGGYTALPALESLALFLPGSVEELRAALQRQAKKEEGAKGLLRDFRSRFSAILVRTGSSIGALPPRLQQALNLLDEKKTAPFAKMEACLDLDLHLQGLLAAHPVAALAVSGSSPSPAAAVSPSVLPAVKHVPTVTAATEKEEEGGPAAAGGRALSPTAPRPASAAPAPVDAAEAKRMQDLKKKFQRL